MAQNTLMLLRQFTTKTKNANLIKNLNYENKILYGAVAKDKMKKRPAKTTKKAVNAIQNESAKSSEMFWLTKNVKRDEKMEFCNEPVGERTPITSNVPFIDEDVEKITRFPFSYEKNVNLFQNSSHLSYEGKLPSVGKILSATMSDTSREALVRYKTTKIEELGLDGFRKLEQDHLTKGRLMHSAIENYLSTGLEPSTDSEIYTLWQSVNEALQKFKSKENHSEVKVEHPLLKYCGIVDCVSVGGSNISVIEFKKSDKIKNKLRLTYDAPVQLCAYTGALNYSGKYDKSIRNGFVIVGYTDGQPADVHVLNELDLKKYWRIWLQRLQQFWTLTKTGALPPPI